MALQSVDAVGIPFYLPPGTHRLGFQQVRLYPGVTFGPMPRDITNQLEQVPSLASKRLGPSHFLFVSHKPYISAITEEIRAEGKLTSDLSDGLINEFPTIYGFNLAKQFAVAILLSGCRAFEFDNLLAIRYAVAKTPRLQIISSAYGNYVASSFALREITNLTPTIPLSARVLAKQFGRINRYFRPGLWWNDRYAIALNSLLAAFSSHDQADSFIRLISVIESLISTQDTEITHLLAERCAVLLKRTSRDRLTVYDQVKDLYNIRSRIVHGSAHAKKGTINRESLHFSAIRTIVPQSKILALRDLVISVFNALLANKRIAGIIQSDRNNEDTTKKELNRTYTEMVLAS